MNLSVEQIFYTSFSDIGFTALSSSLISPGIEEFFIKKIVETYWNSYNPPELGYRGIYLHQLSVEETFFGWLYNDGSDDFGRSDIPYFICYFFYGKLTSSLLKLIWNCLELGPIMMIDRKYPPHQIKSLRIPNTCNYQPARLGVDVPISLQKATENTLQNSKLITQFIANDYKLSMDYNAPLSHQYPEQPLTLLPSSSAISQRASMNPLTIENILQDLLMKPIDIKGLALVSQDGQPLTAPMGIDEDTTSILSGNLLYVAQTTETEFNWQEIDRISLRSPTGYLILARCTPEHYLLIKAGKVLTGLLEGEIGRTVKKLQTVLQTPNPSLLQLASSAQPINHTISVENQVLEAWTETSDGQNTGVFPKILQQELLQMAQGLIDQYPDLVAAVRDIDSNPDIGDEEMLTLGEYVGQGLVEQGKVKRVSLKNVVSGLNKLVVPAICYFMIADAQDNELNVHANPFCLHKTSDEPSCYFLRGMIKGLLTSVTNLPQVTVEEIRCKATGANSCTFRIMEQEVGVNGR